MEQENNSLLSRVLNRVLNKEHSPKAFKRLASLVLAGAIGLSLSACNVSNAIDGSSKDSSTKYEDSSNIDSSDSSNIDSSDSSSIEEPPIDVDYSKFSPIIQAMFNNDYYVALTQKIQENVANGNYTDYYSHPTMFWDSIGIDANKIRSGEIECQTNAFVYKKSEPNNLYIATYITDPTNTYYDQYIIRYTLTEQEMSEYYTLRELKVWQNFYMNDILSIYKKPEIIQHGKINIETYNFLKNYFDNNLYLAGFEDIILQFEKDLDGKAEVSMYIVPEKPYPAGKPNDKEWGLPSNRSVEYCDSIIFNEGVKYSFANDIFCLDESSIDTSQDFFTIADCKSKRTIDYCRQDLCCELFPYMYSELKPEHLAEFLEKVNEKTENK